MNFITARVGKSFFFYTLGFIFFYTTVPFKEANANFPELGKIYGLKSCASRNQAEDDEENTVECASDDYFYSALEENCKEAKEKATKCCEDPSVCNNIGVEIAKGALVLSPALITTINSYKVTKKVSKDRNLTAQERADALCSSHNKIAMGHFASNLMGQLMPLFEKDCADKIKQCRNSCGRSVTAFKNDLKNTYNRFRIFGGKNIKNTIKLAKECLYGDKNNTSLDEISFTEPETDTDRLKSFEVFLLDSGKKYLKEGTNENNYSTNLSNNTKCHINQIPDSDNYRKIKVFSQVLFYAKAYRNTMKEEKEVFAFNEKEIVDCGKQPNRITTSNKTPGGPLSPPQIRICEQVVKAHSYNSNPKPPVSGNSVNVPNSNIGMGSLQGNNPMSGRHPLLSENEDGEDDDLGLFSDDLPLGLDNRKPSLSDTPPGFTGGNSGSGSMAGASPGGGGAGGGGSSGSEEGGEYYEDDPNIGSFGGGFPGGNYGNSAYPMDSGGGESYLGDREVAGDEDDDEGAYQGGDDNFANTEESGGSIFEMASKRIQSFCSNLKCDL